MAVKTPHTTFALVDVETTGSSPTNNRILEIAVIRIEEGNVVEEFNTVIDPECFVPASITSLTGITETDVQHAPTFNDISRDIERLLAGAIFVAHNAQFDYAFVKSEFKRLGKSFTAKRLCTVKLSRKLFPEFKRHDLSSLISRYDFICNNRHRALADTKVLVQFLEYCQKNFGEKYIEVAQKIISHGSVPDGIPRYVVDSLPEKSGVYIFYGDQGDILYIGKSINIKRRVMSHFSNALSGKAQRLIQEVKDIEVRETHGELGALLLESHLVKREQPLYNRMLRYARKLIALYEVVDDRGYKRVEMRGCATNKNSKEDLQEKLEELSEINSLGIFKSKSQAKKILQTYAEKYQLCQVLLGLENSKICFGSQIERCSGACFGKEAPELYNARFDLAFKKRKIKSWPFSGAIIIKEKSPDEKYAGTAFIIDNWKLIKSFKYNEEGDREDFLPESPFDYDAYKILADYIVKNSKNIQLFTQRPTKRRVGIIR